ncbi:MAG: hypothetical protein IT177_17785 [Acidobacteria bacterium]|nr:hypothetical protein [Acidobacteriota bacterium]
MSHSRASTIAAGLGLLIAGYPFACEWEPRPDAVIVADIIRADYEADLPLLLLLYHELPEPAGTAPEASRVRYWRGFARWRRAINGLNDGAPVAQMLEDLQIASREFEAALSIAPGFVDARAGLLSSLGTQLFLLNGDTVRMQPIVERVRPMMSALRSKPQDNPRMLWVLGQAEWRTPSGWPRKRVLAHQERVIASYLRALELARAQEIPSRDDLEPRWGEPELLMNLAWSNLNKVTADLSAAERNAREALRLVPNWHYVRDILLPQILAAKYESSQRAIAGAPGRD